MATNNFFKSDLPKLHNVVQNAMIVYPKEIILAHLRDHFSKDTYYHYSKDAWGFANTPDHTDLPLGAGVYDETTTRVFIGENYRQDVTYYPAILIKHGGSRSVPISINREEGSIQWKIIEFDDGYGNKVFYRTPKAFLFQGAWEGSINIEINAKNLGARDDLVEIVALCLTDIVFKSLQKAGVIVKPITVSAPTETDDRNEKLFRQNITLEIRTEWRREIPVGNLVEIINFSMDFADLLHDSPVAPNLTINTNLRLLDNLMNALFEVKPQK